MGRLVAVLLVDRRATPGSAPAGRRPRWRPAGWSAAWWARPLAALLALALALVAAPPAEAQAGDWERTWVRTGSTDGGMVILEYRAATRVSARRNVAAFGYLDDDRNAVWVAAASYNASARGQDVLIGVKTGDTKIEIQRFSVREFETRFGFNPVNKHAEFLVFAYMTDEQRRRVVVGESEFDACAIDGVDCRQRLAPNPGADPSPDGPFFPNLRRFYYQFPYGNGDERQNEDSRLRHERVVRRWLRHLDHAGGTRPFNEFIERTLDPSVSLPADGQNPQAHGYHAGLALGLFGFEGGLTSGPLAELGSAATALLFVGALGGIDFTTLELRYVADPGDGQGLRYAFHASPSSEGEEPDPDAGRRAARHASDAFFVWLSLPPSSFWVNLHPYEPDRIIDPALATTDVGRILLEADLQLKRTQAALIHPDTELGREYWQTVEATGEPSCPSMRMWIVPGAATVYEEDGELYILDAPLEVRMEAEGLVPSAGPGPTHDPCGRPEGAPEPPDQRFLRERVLPLVERAVNEAPEFAELRQVYLSRVAAEWYRQRSRHSETSLSWLIDSGYVGAWPAAEEWSPQDVFEEYVVSVTEGEFNVRREVRRGSHVHDVTYFYGGVDFTKVTFDHVDRAEFAEDWAGLPEEVDRAIHGSTTLRDDGVWLGGAVHHTVPANWPADPTRDRTDVRRLATTVIAAVLTLIAAGIGISMFVVLKRGGPRRQTLARRS